MSDPAPKKKKFDWKSPIKYIVGFALLAFVIGTNWEDKLEDRKDLQTGLVQRDPETDAPLKDRIPGLKSLMQRTPDFAMFAIAGLLAAGCIGTQYFRWYGLVRALDLPFTLRNAVRLGMVGTFYNTFLPGAIGGDLVKAYFIAKGQPDRKAAAVSTVVADRLLGLFGLLVFAGFLGGAIWASGTSEKLNTNPTLQKIILGCAIASVIGALGYIALGFLPKARAAKFGERLKGIRKVGGTLAELWETALRYRQRPMAILVGIGLSAVSHTLMMLLFHFAVQVFPPEDATKLGHFAEHIVIGPIGFIVQALLPIPGGIGVAEFSFGGLYELIRPGGGRVVGLTGRLAIRVIEWILGGLCYIVYLSMKAELPVGENGEREDSPRPSTGAD